MKKYVVSLVWGLSVGFIAAAAVADEKSNPQKGQFYITPGVVQYEAPAIRRHGHDDFTGPGLILGYGLSDSWALEVMLASGESEWTNTLGTGEDDINLASLSALYKFDVESVTWQPFVVFGAGATEFGFNNARSESKDTQVNLGAGVFAKLSDRLSLRLDVRALSSNNTSKGVEPSVFLGISGFIGKIAPPPPPPDSDGDGVADLQDQCLRTPVGRKVNAVGCQIDADSDGVLDFDDRCPNTPAGAPVDRRGCPLDTDRDGVADYLDQCPGSERGSKVDAKGCYIELEETVTIDMNIEFDTNKAEIRSDHVSEISSVVIFLRQYPTANAIIEGHTDSDGAAAYNQALSERRARAVHDYLVNEAGIADGRLTWQGHGETRPIAPNSTSAGKQKNRRVSAVVSGSQTVRQYRDE